ncbi:MAG TPA: RNA pseudouridine synthase [Bacteroidales bacterium]|nr:MAG: RNA pseudouridine synthase [Bacteroidetes bacterium GWF2_33_38]OFY85144.1 MAG: RNA pseudouridine synthase [Bacteroidetes bacterium RIFOXYA2_FULL_33_7]HBF89449.1 RNA pseudouridine synthase [Bacteroidales bacterium]
MLEETIETLNLEEEHSDLYEHFRFVVDKGQSLFRIDKYLTQRIENISRSKVQSAAEAGNILVNDKQVKSNYRIKPYDVISILMTFPPQEKEPIAEDIPLNIVYEDDDLLVINKPAGMVVHPGHGNFNGTLINALMYYLKDEPLFKKGEMRPGLVHRIDKNTSGLLVVGKNEFALNKLAKQFFDKTSERKYLALVWGYFDEKEGTIVGNIGRSPKDKLKMTVFSDNELGKHAVTHYKIVEQFNYVTLVECILETGRTHQIRVHFEHIKHPLFNDERYGGNEILKGTTFSKYKQFVNNCFNIIPRHALHAKTLGFVHPRTGEKMVFESELPTDMVEVLDKWRRYSINQSEM